MDGKEKTQTHFFFCAKRKQQIEEEKKVHTTLTSTGNNIAPAHRLPQSTAHTIAAYSRWPSVTKLSNTNRRTLWRYENNKDSRNNRGFFLALGMCRMYTCVNAWPLDTYFLAQFRSVSWSNSKTHILSHANVSAQVVVSTVTMCANQYVCARPFRLHRILYFLLYFCAAGKGIQWRTRCRRWDLCSGGL